MTRSITLFPYNVTPRITVRLEDFDDPVGGQPLAIRELASPDAAAGESSPFGYDATMAPVWSKLTFRLNATLVDSEVARVVSERKMLDSHTMMLATLNCAGTRFRHGVPLTMTGPGKWSGLITLQREDLRGIVAIRSQLVLTKEQESNGNLARDPGSVIGYSDVVQLFVDEQPKRLGTISELVTVSWEDFANSDHVWRRQHPDDVFHLEPYGSSPRLYLNSRYSQLREVMDATAKSGPTAILRDSTAAMIAQPVLLQLSIAAVAAIEFDEASESVMAPSGWRGEVLDAVLPQLYPEVTSPDEQLRRAAQELRDADGAGSLVARIGTVVQELISLYKTVESAVRAHESASDRGGNSDD